MLASYAVCVALTTQSIPLPIQSPNPLRTKDPDMRATVSTYGECELAATMRIDAESFPDPWSIERLSHALTGETADLRVVSNHERGVDGFAITHKYKHYIYLLRLAVDADHRRRGAGTQLVDSIKSLLTSRGRNQIMVEVRESNLAAQLFYQSCGFLYIATVRKFYDDNEEDAYLMEFTLPEDTRGKHRKRRLRLLDRGRDALQPKP